MEQVNKYDNKYITIPNLLSMFRLCLVPVIVWLYAFESMYILTIIFTSVCFYAYGTIDFFSSAFKCSGSG